MRQPKTAKPASEKKPKDSAAAAKSTVQSLAKGFRVLEIFSDDRDDLTLSEVASEADLDAGTTYRLLTTLVNLGYVHRDEKTKRFSLTLKVLDLGFHAIGRRDIRSIARPALRRLVHDTGEAASFAVLEGADVLYIERVRSGLVRFGVDIRVGTTIPAHISVIGQCILAFLSPASLDAYMAVSRDRTHNFRDKRSAEDVLPTLASIREKGYVVGESTLTEGLRILAVPVLGQDGDAIGAVSITTPTVRRLADNLEKGALQGAKAAAREIAAAIEANGSVEASIAVHR
ncbi:IclR family pca regulon transcriptional regulator [Rhodoblastus acidophilus]|uniref:IclR family transcriptional regulator n=1 Tax=Rhodoblastus acidophilus TaxID=1074 RepID=UPI0022255C7B|nr:IclR family transcriptional regulator [Rhodoblastus acidophilus]MCW2285817.1 IclR family pca regulon transcriptional regulator [Rhodoblastus acidophilus]MCW2333360.1 IclR family pca regulon transcriptional regulator [Rhodoblastus acidophilus]